MELVSQHLIVIREKTWNYKYNTVEEFKQHKAKMKQKGVLADFSHISKNGNVIATYIETNEGDYSEHI